MPKQRGQLLDTYVAALQHDLVELPVPVLSPGLSVY